MRSHRFTEWGTGLKSSKRLLYIQWLVVTAFITIVCVGAGNFLFHYLSTREEMGHKERIFGPFKNRLEVMKSLIESKKLSATEVFAIVDKAGDAPFAEKTELLDQEGKVLASHVSAYWNDDLRIRPDTYVLTPDLSYRVYLDHKGRHRGPPGGPPGSHPGGPPRMPSGFLIIALTVTGVSIIVGVGLSLLLLTFYLRRRAKQVEKVMTRIQSGDLSARFDIGQADEVGELMSRFNDMAVEIEKLVTNLRETEESRKKMLQELAHDLRTPVASMKNLQEILFTKGDKLDSEKKSQIQNLAMKEVLYFERLVEDLLFLSGVNDPRYSSSLKDVSLTQLISEEAEFFRVKEINVVTDVKDEISVKGDEMLLRRLLRNALSNAVRYANKEVKLFLSKDAEGIKLVVRDDGPGLPEKDIAVFGQKKISRDLSIEKGHISVGLGSVIMKKIMDIHNGKLALRNVDPGVELTFIFK